MLPMAFAFVAISYVHERRCVDYTNTQVCVNTDVQDFVAGMPILTTLPSRLQHDVSTFTATALVLDEHFRVGWCRH